MLIGIDEHSASARMSRYENGVHEAAISTARRLAVALNVPLAFLYCDDDKLAEMLLLAHDLSPKDQDEVIKLMSKKVEQASEIPIAKKEGLR